MSLNVMISYPSERGDEARDVYEYLVNLGLSVWFDKACLVAGDDWNREISTALTKAELFVVVCSKETVNKSGVVQRELNRILDLAKDQPLGHIFIVNILVEEVSLPAELSRFQWIVMPKDNWRQALARAVLKKLSQLERQPTPEIEETLASFVATDNIRINSISQSEGDADYRCSYPCYPAHDDYWRYINSQINATVYESYYDARRFLKYYSSDEFKASRNGDLGWNLIVDEYFRDGNLLSIRCLWFLNNGGAHPSRGTFTLNFGGRDCGRIHLNDLFTYGNGAIEHIKEYCELDIRRQAFAVGEDVEIDLSSYAPDGLIENVFREFNFDARGIVFNLSELSGLPFVLGTHEIHMPWDYFRDKIDDVFKASEVGYLISSDGEIDNVP